MNNISDEQLLAFNQMGMIPGPSEKSDDFLKRANYCLDLKSHLSKELTSHLSDATDLKNSPNIDPVKKYLKKEYDFILEWIPIFFSNYRLNFWHGGCAWIFQQEETTPMAALIQLRKTLRHSPTYLGLYHRDELLRHELTHVGRMMFQEPCFEEILAYNTSPSSWRKYFGPILQSSMESILFVLTLFLIIIFDLFLIATGHSDAYMMALWIKLIPLGLIGAAVIRLWHRHNVFRRCLNHLKSCLGNKNDAKAVIYRLRDHEIRLFAYMNEQELKTYAQAHVSKELRWRLIYLAYFSDKWT